MRLPLFSERIRAGFVAKLEIEVLNPKGGILSRIGMQ
jgi:hypothetical protein